MEEDLIETAKAFLIKAEKAGVKVVLPRDFVVAPDLKEESQKVAVHVRTRAHVHHRQAAGDYRPFKRKGSIGVELTAWLMRGLIDSTQADVKSYSGEGYGVDIGPLTVGDFHNEISNAKTFLWNGPMGILEMPRYALGTST